MAERIKLLPEIVANQIAAGEVVKHPSSVVKEMMENAIDAGAKSVKVNIREGGRDLIQIVDDGCGMSPIDARMAFDRHATSKIKSVDDIYALTTFGFRGEALASIGAVAEVELRTRQEEDEMGTCTEIHGGEFVSQQPVMCPVGAQFLVRNLFYNVPARRKFLDSTPKLVLQVRSEFKKVALCNPKVTFELYVNDAPVYALPMASLAGRIVDVVGKSIKHNLLEVSADTSIARVDGYIGLPAAAKRRNPEQYLFVNGRYFKSAYITSALLKAYEKLIPENTTPSYFLYLTIDPSRIDVNVHPQKLEVKFADEEAVWQIINASVRETLARTGAVPMMDFDKEESVEIPVMEKGAVYKEPRSMSNGAYNPFLSDNDFFSSSDAKSDFVDIDASGFGGDAPQASMEPDSVEYESVPSGSGMTSANEWEEENREYKIPLSDTSYKDAEVTDIESEGNPRFEEFVSGEVNDVGTEESTLDFIPSGADVEQLLPNMEEAKPQFSSPMPMAGGYILAFMSGRLVVVDVRRARERILYEDYMRMISNGSSVSQQLLFPEKLTLSLDEYHLLEEHDVEFASLGFDIDYCGEGVIEVKGAPADLPIEVIDQMLYSLLQAFSMPVSLEEVRREKIASAMAVGASKGLIRNLNREECEALLAQLADTGNISFTPSGKSIVAEITADEIRKKLG